MSELQYVFWRCIAGVGFLISLLTIFFALWRLVKDILGLDKGNFVEVESAVEAWFYDLPVLHPCVPLVLDTIPGWFTVKLPVILRGELREEINPDEERILMFGKQLESFFRERFQEWYEGKQKLARYAYRGEPEELQRAVANIPMNPGSAASFLRCFKRVWIKVGKAPEVVLGVYEF